jgi:ATP phosphoribosyltransferase
VLVVAGDSPVKPPEDLQASYRGGFVSYDALVQERKIDVQIEFSWGATEAKGAEAADAIVEVTETDDAARAWLRSSASSSSRCRS